MLADGARDLVSGAVVQVQVFEPVSTGPLTGSVDDFPEVGNAGEDGRHEEDGPDSGFMDPAKGVQPSPGCRRTGFEMAAEGIVE